MKKRVISAVIMAVILIPILIIGGSIYAIAIGMIGILALKELLDLKISHNKIPDLMLLISAIDFLLLTFSEFEGYSIAFGLSYKALAITFMSLFIPTLFYKDAYKTSDAMYVSGSVVLLGLVCNSLILVRNYDLAHLIYLLLITIITDTFALLIGKLIGKHKLCPNISPNKTIEGSIGGVIIASFIATVYYINIIQNKNVFIVILVSILLSIISQFGDLVFSKIKRENKIKDYSKLIPAHGGVLDRIDSLSFVILIYILLFGII